MNETDNETFRLFIALDFSRHICAKLVKLQRKITSGIAKIKWVEEENFHIATKL